MKSGTDWQHRGEPMSAIEVVIGDGSVTIRRSGRSAPIVAQVLGLDRDPDGAVIRIWLDRLVHRPGGGMDGRMVGPWGGEFDHRARWHRRRWRVQTPTGRTMSAHGATRQRAFQTACTLAAAGKRPTIAAVREGLGGKGSQQAIGARIDDWLDEAARRFQIPSIPEALRTQVVAVWDQACRLAGEQWENAKTALEARVLGLDAQVAAVAGERDAARTESERLAAELNSQGTTLRETLDALDLADIDGP